MTKTRRQILAAAAKLAGVAYALKQGLLPAMADDAVADFYDAPAIAKTM